VVLAFGIAMYCLDMYIVTSDSGNDTCYCREYHIHKGCFIFLQKRVTRITHPAAPVIMAFFPARRPGMIGECTSIKTKKEGFSSEVLKMNNNNDATKKCDMTI